MRNSFKHLQHTAGTVNLCACNDMLLCAAAPLLNDG